MSKSGKYPKGPRSPRLGATTSGYFVEVNNCLIWCSTAYKPFGSTFVLPSLVNWRAVQWLSRDTFYCSDKAKLLQLKLIHLFSREVLLVKKLEIKKKASAFMKQNSNLSVHFFQFQSMVFYKISVWCYPRLEFKLSKN